MSKDTETQFQAANSYTSMLLITRSSAHSKSGCPKCDAKNLPVCGCSKGGAEEDESEEKYSDSAEKTKEINSMQQTGHFSEPCFKSAEAQAQEIENIMPEEEGQSFSPSPFSMTLTAY